MDNNNNNKKNAGNNNNNKVNIPKFNPVARMSPTTNFKAMCRRDTSAV